MNEHRPIDYFDELQQNYFDELLEQKAALIKKSRDANLLGDAFSLLKDEAVKRSDFVEASKYRNSIDELKNQTKDLAGYKKAKTIENEKIAQLEESQELAWGIIANAYGGDWSLASEEWRAAATRWRDAYHGPRPSCPAGLPEVSGIPHIDTIPWASQEDLVAAALDKLFGTLSHDNVAAAKQILKNILD